MPSWATALISFRHSAEQNRQKGNRAVNRSRTPEFYIVVCQHEQLGCVVIDAAERLLARVAPFCVGWKFSMIRRRRTCDGILFDLDLLAQHQNNLHSHSLKVRHYFAYDRNNSIYRFSDHAIAVRTVVLKK